MTDGRSLADLDYCYLTTTGRRTGGPHRIEIWFALGDGVVYLLSGGGDRSDWVRNLEVSPDVVLEIGGEARTTQARVVTDPRRTRSPDGSSPTSIGLAPEGISDDWERTSVPVAIEWR